VEFKLRGTVEKWILRQPLKGLLPESVLQRTKSKFWQGAGVGELLADHAENIITNDDFRRERRLPNGWGLNSKEELLYYRLFCEHFGEVGDLRWMGRTKGAPEI
jgi:asparagine synthase (glutamine-hydrolysing)